MEDSPSFRVFLDDNSASKCDESSLRIPSSFSRVHWNRFDTKSRLRGPDGCLWDIGVFGECALNIGFRRGWSVFVAAYGFKQGDLLWVKLVSDNLFEINKVEIQDWADDVNIAKATAAQTTGAVDADVKATAVAESALTQTMPKIPKGGGSSQTADLEAQERQEKKRKSVKGVAIRNEKRRLGQERLINERPGKKQEQPIDENRSRGKRTRPINEDRSRGKKTQQERPTKRTRQERPINEDHRGKGRKGREVPVTEDDIDRAKQIAEDFAYASGGPNPRVLVVLNKSCVYTSFWLTIRRSFARTYMPDHTCDMVLLDTKGNRWHSKWLFNEQSCGISAGWRRFALDNKLEESDVCVFELLDGSPESLKMLVHIFRVISLQRAYTPVQEVYQSEGDGEERGGRSSDDSSESEDSSEDEDDVRFR